MKIITGTSGRINELLKGIPNEEFVSSSPFGDGKVMIVVKGEVGERAPVGELIFKEVEVIKEVIKEVDNPEHMELLEEAQEQIQTLQDALSDALNAEQAAKKEAEDLKKQIPKLKASVAKLKKVLAED